MVRGADGPFAAGGAGALAGAGAGGLATEVPGRVAVAAGAAGAAAGAAVAGRGICAVAAAAGPADVVRAGAGAAVGGGGAPGAAEAAGGIVGSLIVGAAVGFGGRAIRTVSFFGWTLAASGGLGGTPPGGGGTGFGSAIQFDCCEKLWGAQNGVKPLLDEIRGNAKGKLLGSAMLLDDDRHLLAGRALEPLLQLRSSFNGLLPGRILRPRIR